MKLNDSSCAGEVTYKGPTLPVKPILFDSLVFFNDDRVIKAIKSFSNSLLTLPGKYYVKRDLGNKWVIRKGEPKHKEFVLVEFELIQNQLDNSDGHLPHSPKCILEVIHTKIHRNNPDYFKDLDLENVSVSNSKKFKHTSAIIKD